MTRWGHLLTSAGLSYAVFQSQRQEALSLAVAPDALLVGFVQGVMPAGLAPWLCCLGILAGGMLPDQLEMSRYGARGRASLIPHRTLTHWPGLWLTVLAVAVYGCLYWNGMWQFFAVCLLGVTIGALLHLVIDFASPSGIPIGHPGASGTSIALYRTNGASEILAITLITGGLYCAGVWL